MSAATATATTAPKHTILTTTYSTLKETWIAGKDYKVVSTILPFVESIGEKAVTLTSNYTGADSLEAVDDKLTPALADADVAVSPFVESTLESVESVSKKLEPVTIQLKKVLPINTATAVGGYVYKTATADLKYIEKKMRLEAPEVTTEAQ
jgi:hypothetical protein